MFRIDLSRFAETVRIIASVSGGLVYEHDHFFENPFNCTFMKGAYNEMSGVWMP